MKTFSQLIRSLFRDSSKKQASRPGHEEKTDNQPARNSQKSEHSAFANDDSPPGGKVRWHH